MNRDVGNITFMPPSNVKSKLSRGSFALETSGANGQEVSSQQPAVINLMNHLDGPKSVPNDHRLPSTLSSVSTNPV